MNHIYYKNGFYFVESEDGEVFNEAWLTPIETKLEGTKYYFHLNPYTRRKFADKFLNNPKYYISNEDLERIKVFKLTQHVDFDKDFVPCNLKSGKELKDYQVQAVNLMLHNKNYCLFLGPGTGKTMIAVNFIMNARPKQFLVITPLSVVGQYKGVLEEYIDYECSYEVINKERLPKVDSSIVYDLIIIDESHTFANLSNQTYKILQGFTFERMFLFSGTPQDKSEIEILTQINLFDRRIIPTKSRFIQRYFELDDFYNPKRLKPEMREEIYSIINNLSMGLRTEDVIELPDYTETNIKYNVPPIYNKLKEDFVINDGEIECCCDTPSKLAIKLREICNGFLTDDNNKTIRFHSDKHDILKNIVDKVSDGIIFTQFDIDIEVVSKVLTNSNRSYKAINGKTKKKLRDQYIEEFKKAEFEFLIIQSASGNAGLDLYITNNIIFFSLPTSYKIFYQCQCRIRRLGQTKQCNYFYITARKSVEEHIFQLLKKKKSFNASLYARYKESNKWKL